MGNRSARPSLPSNSIYNPDQEEGREPQFSINGRLSNTIKMYCSDLRREYKKGLCFVFELAKSSNRKFWTYKVVEPKFLLIGEHPSPVPFGKSYRSAPMQVRSDFIVSNTLISFSSYSEERKVMNSAASPCKRSGSGGPGCAASIGRPTLSVIPLASLTCATLRVVGAAGALR